MKQLMLDLIHPASNDILLFVNRGAPKNRNGVGHCPAQRADAGRIRKLAHDAGRARDQGDWAKDAKTLADVGTAAYKAAQAKDFTALAALAESLDASCTTCHKQYRPNVFPRGEGRVEMSYSRRNFLKAAGSGVVLTAVGGESVFRRGRCARLFRRR